MGSGTGRRVTRNDAVHRIQTDVVGVFVAGTLLLSSMWAPAQPRRMSGEVRPDCTELPEGRT